ncbi:sulfurtransferase [Streptomyces sp. NBC_00335]|uniref:sulfurtransferase n=1 Tax=unclassified Streptomyces TaxID=2593676 RepID=UPI002252E6A0|nr:MULTISPECIES: sulfurtransferase [unclassified Streptomyces]MCX5403904.1 sulfurtransferase [Streptomyces sp. NBC_00086]
MARASAVVTGEWAAAHLTDPGTVFVETGNSDADFQKGHVPGAVWIGWDEFQDAIRLGVIDRGAFEELLSAKGIGNEDTVVVYSVNSNLLAALTLWYFRLYGHRSVRLLDGGREKWQRDGRPLTSDETVRPATGYRAEEPDTSIRATRDDVLAAIGAKNLLDVRTPDEYAGRIFAPGFAGEAFTPGNSPHDVAQRAGHVPGAVNLEWDSVLDEDGALKSEEELRRIYGRLDPERGSITYCWVGARSAHSWFVLSELLGWPDVKNYDGSWGEYGSLLGVPVERGDGSL